MFQGPRKPSNFQFHYWGTFPGHHCWKVWHLGPHRVSGIMHVLHITQDGIRFAFWAVSPFHNHLPSQTTLGTPCVGLGPSKIKYARHMLRKKPVKNKGEGAGEGRKAFRPQCWSDTCERQEKGGLGRKCLGLHYGSLEGSARLMHHP